MNNGIIKYSTAALTAALLALTGCGGSGSDGESSSSSSVASSSSSSSSSVDSDNWELVWSDEFEGETIDTEKWGFEVNCAGGGNNELQCYTAREDNAQISDGKLLIIAKEESYAGPSMFDDDPNYDPEDTSAQRNYTSARLRSKDKGDWKYGRIEINAKMPQGQGIWPALWMLPTDWVYGGWPMSGEIDIFEAVNTNASGGNEVHGTLHYGFPWPNNRYSGASTTPEANIWEEFHTYAIEWEEGAIHWFVNDTHFATQTDDGWFTYYWDGETRGYKVGEGAAPFDQQFHLIMNIAVGGNWPGSPNAETEFPQTMEIEYARVYQCSLDTETGAGCSTDLDPEITPLTGNPAPAQEEFPLYDSEGAASLELETPDGQVTNTLVPGFWQPDGTSNVLSNPAAIGDDGNAEWTVEFFGTGNIFLTTDDMADVDNVSAGLNLTSMSSYGEVRFDILVEEKAAEAEIAIKMDSGWPNVSSTIIDPPEGEWTRMSVAIADLNANTVQPGQVDLAKVTNPFVLEVSGGAVNITLRNIVLRCPEDCAVEPILEGQSSVIEAPHTVFDDELDINWNLIGTWATADGHVTTAVVDAEDAARGQVLDVQFGDSGANGIAFFQNTSATKDMSVFSGGQLQFDVQVLNYGSATGLVVKADCVHPCSSGDIDIGMVGDSGWETVTLEVADLVAGGLDLTKVNTPFVIFPTWGSQSNVQLQVDNVRYLAP